MKFRKKPVVIEAYQLPGTGEDVPESFHDWCNEVGFTEFESGRDETLVIPTLEGDMVASPGDWIIKGVKGEFYPCKPDIFAATYEAADEQTLSDTDRLNFIAESGSSVRRTLDSRKNLIVWGWSYPNDGAGVHENLRAAVDAAIAKDERHHD